MTGTSYDSFPASSIIFALKSPESPVVFTPHDSTARTGSPVEVELLGIAPQSPVSVAKNPELNVHSLTAHSND